MNPYTVAQRNGQHAVGITRPQVLLSCKWEGPDGFDRLQLIGVNALGFKLFFGAVVLMRARCEVLERERNSRWVQALVEHQAG